MFCHFCEKFKNSKWPPFLEGKIFVKIADSTFLKYPWVENFDKWGGEIFLKIAKSAFLRYPVDRKFRRNRSISHSLGYMSTFAFFSTQNSQLLIYLINYSLIYEPILPKSNPIQAIILMNLHTKFRKDRLNSIP